MTTPVRDPILDLTEALLGRELAPALAARDIGKDHEDFYIRTPRFARLLAFLADLLLIALNGVAAFLWFCVAPVPLAGEPLPGRPTAGVLLLYSAAVILACRALHLYIRPRRTALFGDLGTISKAVLLATGLLLADLYLENDLAAVKPVLLAGVLDLGALLGWRAVRLWVTQRRVAAGLGTRNVLIIGAGRVGRALAQFLAANPQLGYAVKGFLDESPGNDPQVLGTVADFRNIVRTRFVEDVLVTIPSQREMVRQIVSEAEDYGVRVRVVPELFDGLGLQAPIDYVGKFPVMELYRQPISTAGLYAKRALDLAVSSAALVLTAPLMLLVAIAIRLGSPGPVLYRSERVGKKGLRFVCYKFRSMVANADALKEEMRQRNYRSGPTFKIDRDPRVTRLGEFLRRYSLDELPQLWNILRGDMSLVGPRPHPLDDFAQYDPEHMVRLQVKPGLTGLWQVMARRDPSFERNMQLDLEYIENWTLALDFKILFRTLPAVLKGNGE